MYRVFFQGSSRQRDNAFNSLKKIYRSINHPFPDGHFTAFGPQEMSHFEKT